MSVFYRGCKAIYLILCYLFLLHSISHGSLYRFHNENEYISKTIIRFISFPFVMIFLIVCLIYDIHYSYFEPMLICPCKNCIPGCKENTVINLCEMLQTMYPKWHIFMHAIEGVYGYPLLIWGRNVWNVRHSVLWFSRITLNQIYCFPYSWF